jgi:hypothetical protein
MALLDDRVAEALCPLLLITGWTKLLWDAQLGPAFLRGHLLDALSRDAPGIARSCGADHRRCVL